MSVSGTAGTERAIAVGAQHMTSVEGEWSVHVLDRRGGLRRRLVSSPGPGWRAQGALFAVGGELWGIRFDQRPGASSAGGMLTRLVVVRERGGELRQVGLPLRDQSGLSTPLYYGLVASGRRVLAVATVPAPGGTGDELRVFRLDRGPA